jgi:hypothetical protein
MKLTKDERHTAYIILQAEVEEYKKRKIMCFICLILEDYDIYEDDLPEILPELSSMQPEKLHHSGGWFGTYDYASRIKLLNKCIEETYNF